MSTILRTSYSTQPSFSFSPSLSPPLSPCVRVCLSVFFCLCLYLIFLDVIGFQIVDDEYNEVPPGTQGRVVVRVQPYCPVGMFTRYVVSQSLGNTPHNSTLQHPRRLKRVE